LGDASAAKFSGQDGFNFGQRVEPVEKCGGFLAVLEAVIQLAPDVAREPGDFARRAAAPVFC
jgi:hypothetical protein